MTGFLFREQEDQIIPTLKAYNIPGIELTDSIREMLGMAPEAQQRAG